MKKIIAVWLLLAAFFLAAAGHNDYFSKSAIKSLRTEAVTVSGETACPGPVDFRDLPLRHVNVREAVLKKKGREFAGSYHYSGYSLFDILKSRIPRKKNAGEFPVPVDMFVVISNRKGDRAVVSWGEIFFAHSSHRIIIATGAAVIAPHKVRSDSRLPAFSRLVCADDLYSVRTIESPSKITVCSAPVSLEVNRQMQYVSSRNISLYFENQLLGKITALPGPADTSTVKTALYGRGRGFHGFHDFTGKAFGNVLHEFYNNTRENMQHAYFVVAAADGYRCVFSFSEIFNGNNGCPVLIMSRGICETKGGFSLFPRADFFSDRAVGGISSIRLMRAYAH